MVVCYRFAFSQTGIYKLLPTFKINSLNYIKMRKWIKLIRFIKKHRSRGIASFKVVTNMDTFVITTEDCEQTESSWKENMLRIPYR